MTRPQYDLVIAGGGLVGATLACALRDQPLRIALIDAVSIDRLEGPSFDARSVALGYGSSRIFSALGLWPTFERDACPIRCIHVSNRGCFGLSRIYAKDYGLDALGYVIENRVLGRSLLDAIQNASNIDIMSRAQITGLRRGSDHVELDLETDGIPTSIRASLVAAADGQRSLVRDAVGIKNDVNSYDQVAIVANLSTSLPHRHIAYERFTQNGPLAMLPLSQDRVAMVWMVAPRQAPGLLAMDEMTFATHLNETFGRRLGNIVKVGQRASYPLALVRSRERVAPRVVLIGNAAQSLHPVAGQGLNLGLRDIAALAEVVMGAARARQDLGAQAVLREYDQWRVADTRAIVMITDTLARVFANPFGPVSVLRNLGLIALDQLPPIKGYLARRSMGLSGPLPRLARGLAL